MTRWTRVVCCAVAGVLLVATTLDEDPPDTPPGILPPGGAGAGKDAGPCTGITVLPGENNLETAVANAGAGETLCISGYHWVTSSLHPKSNQRWVGADSNARISGGVILPAAEWTSAGPGLWVYKGEYAQRPRPDLSDPYPYPVKPCFEVSQYPDDVFYRETTKDLKRMMRVTRLEQMQPGASLPLGQAVTNGEAGRFFFDYDNDAIYIDRSPQMGTVELALVKDLLDGGGASNVSLENLWIEVALRSVIDARGAPGWQVKNCTIRYGHNFGIWLAEGTQAAPFRVLGTVISNNGQFGITGSSWTQIEDSELSWNNIANYRQALPDGGCGGYWMAGAAKFFNTRGDGGAPGLSVTRLESHHNLGDGFWTDVNNRDVEISGSWFHDNERNGYFHEISCNIQIHDAWMYQNGRPFKNPAQPDSPAWGAGLNVLDSNNGRFYRNTMYSNPGGGVILRWTPHLAMLPADASDPGCFSAESDSDVRNALKHNRVVNNDIYMCKGHSGGYYAGLDDRSNFFTGNRWHVKSDTAFWHDGSADLTWSDWQAAGHDTDGSRVLGCTSP